MIKSWLWVTFLSRASGGDDFMCQVWVGIGSGFWNAGIGVSAEESIQKQRENTTTTSSRVV
jgi:hypothetical protein